MLPAAWRKMWVSSVTGAGAGLDQLGERLAGADRRELVGVADEHDVRARRRRRAAASPAARGWPSRSRRRSARRRAARRSSAPGPGTQPSAAWTVDASSPVDSVIRRAARPVGATSSTVASCAAAAAQIIRIVAVLPVPGPPVTIDSRDVERRPHRVGLRRRRARAARRWPPSARSRARPRASSRTASASSASSSAVSRAVGPDRAGGALLEHEPAVLGHLVQQRRASSATPSSSPAAAVSSATGRHVDPSRSASASTWTTPARARRASPRSTPCARAIWSAIWNPTPNTAVRSYGRSRTTRCPRPS